MNDHVEPGGYVEAASGLLLVYAMGAVAGPLISSTFMQHFGPDAMFGVTASVHLALAGFAFYRMRQRARAPDEEPVAFSDSLALAPTVAPVHLAPTEHESEAHRGPTRESPAAKPHTTPRLYLRLSSQPAHTRSVPSSPPT